MERRSAWPSHLQVDRPGKLAMIATIALFVSLGLDTFAVALGLGMKGFPRRRWLNIGLTFALFEGLMPAIGLLVGRTLTGALGDAASYAAGGILVALGAWEIREAIGDDDRSRGDTELALTRSTLLLGLSVSLDELAVGFALGVVGSSLGIALTYIALQAFAITFLGLAIGARVGKRLQERAELVAGILLIVLGVGIVIGTRMGFRGMA
jgi:manganese efflux pump family protein